MRETTYNGSDGCPLYAATIGPAGRPGTVGEGPVVVLLHGGPDHHSLVPLAEQLADSHTVILPDTRGYGRSVCTDPARHTWTQYAADVVGLLDHRGVRRAVVGGAGLGATSALRTAVAYPDRVRALVLISVEDIEDDQAKEAEIAFLDAFAARVRDESLEAAWEPILKDLPPIIGAMVRDAIPRSNPAVEVVIANLTYPTSVEFDDAGTMFVAEGGYIYGDDVAPARVLRISSNGDATAVAENLNGPITDLLWHDKRLYISHRGKVSVLEASGVRDLVTGLPSLGDHHNNQLALGPDGKLYFGQGTATNSGVVGLDNFKVGWLAKYADVHEVPAKDIRVTDQAFETADPLTLLAEKRQSHHGGHASSDEEQPAEAKSSKTGGHEGHAGHPQETQKDKKPAAADQGHAGHVGHGQGDKKGQQEHAGHDSKTKEKTAEGAKGHDGHATQGKDSTKGGAGQTPMTKSGKEGHEGHETEKPQPKHGEHDGGGAAREASKEHSHSMVKSYPMQAFGKTPPDDGAIRGAIKANGTILRMNLDGSDLEVFAWGLRNPFGVMWGPDDELYVTDNGYDERGSRPIAHAPDCLWRIKQGAWYGFPDYAGGVPVTDASFQPENGPAPKFLMRDHPMAEKPLVSLTHHVAAAKIDISRSDQFGFKGQLFVALAGDMNPITGEHEERSGFEVARIDPTDGTVETFFKARKSDLGPKGMEYVATAGPRRPVDVRFSADGSALYVVDIGAMAIISTATGPAPRPFPLTGVVWRISRDGAGRLSRK